ncbi:enoyl-CoA hydratase/isomerase family protein [Alsobacter sp. R-9]
MALVEVERHRRGIVRVVMNHEEARNAVGEALRGALLETFGALLPDPATRVILLASALKNFSVGGDLSRMDTLSDPKEGRRRILSAHRLARLLLAADKPMIAEVRGYAMGAGAGLAIACDTVVAGEGAVIGFPFPKVGLAPDFALGYTLPRRVGPARARQMLLFARNVPAPEALASGLVDEVVPDERVPARAMELAEELAALPSLALQLTKRMLEHAGNPEAVLDCEAQGQPLCFASDDFREGLAAFREKRKPSFDPDVA